MPNYGSFNQSGFNADGAPLFITLADENAVVADTADALTKDAGLVRAETLETVDGISQDLVKAPLTEFIPAPTAVRVNPTHIITQKVLVADWVSVKRTTCNWGD